MPKLRASELAMRRCETHRKTRMLSYTSGEAQDHVTWLWCEDCGALCRRVPSMDTWLLPNRILCLPKAPKMGRPLKKKTKRPRAKPKPKPAAA